MAKAGGAREGYDMQIKLLTIGNSGACWSTRRGLLLARARRPCAGPCARRVPSVQGRASAGLLARAPGGLHLSLPRHSPHPSPAGVGKTCLLLRYAHNSFSPTFITTIGIDFKIKTITVNEKRIKLQVRGAGWRAWGVGPLPKVCPALQRC
jgi:hypothetical protein